MPSVLSDIRRAVGTVFWTAVYFVYFLLKGKREWKCEKGEKPTVSYCCVDGAECSEHQNQFEIRQRKPVPPQPSDNHNSVPKSFYISHSAVREFFSNTWNLVKNGTIKVWESAKLGARKILLLLKAVGAFVGKLIRCLWAVIKTFIFSNNVPSQALPSKPKPYTSKPSSPAYNNVTFQFDQGNLDEKELLQATKLEEVEDEKTIYEDIVTQRVPDKSESFYYERVFDDQSKREKSVPPPAPPPPPVPPKPISRETSRARSMTPGRAITPARERKEVKGGIGGFKSDIMDELEEHQKLRQERASVQREMTQSCHPDMAQWKNENIDRASANSTPWRASSVGPSMRRLEQVVSRIENENNGEPNFVFRPKIVHSSEEYQNKNRGYTQQHQPPKQSSDFLMGRHVFSPVEEAEQMRYGINSKSHGRQQQSYSSPQYQSGNWMEGQRSRNVHRNDQVYDYHVAKNPFGSAAYKSSPYASHTARRSKTPIGSRTEPEGGVESIARQWPPLSNATGLVGNAARDEWIGRSMKDVEEDDNGLVMTMCRRVVERKREDNWKWKDESGRLLDEKNHNIWKGELDTLLRDGPNEGRHWSRTVEKLPTGDTRFQDVNRQYNKDFVVESVVRNY